MFYQLIYVSFSEDNIDSREVEKILENSQTSNIAKDITGALLYHHGIFLQLLEGEEKSVLELYEKIQKDNRHNHITKILESWTEHRMTPKSGMIKVDSTELDVETINCILEFNKYTTDAGRSQVSPDIAAEIFSKFLELCLKQN